MRLIGATTHNPGFYVIAPLLSRSHLFRLEPLSPEVIAGVLALALADSERGLGPAGRSPTGKPGGAGGPGATATCSGRSTPWR